MSSDSISKETLSKLFSGVSQKQLENAMKTAKVLSENPEIKNSFSKISDEKVKKMLSQLSNGDKKKIADTLTSKDNSEITELLLKIKNNLS